MAVAYRRSRSCCSRLFLLGVFLASCSLFYGNSPVHLGSGDIARSQDGIFAIVHEGRPLLPLLQGAIWQKPPRHTPMPPQSEFALRREMVERRAVNNIIIVTFANFAFLDLVLNWVQHLTDLGLSNLLVGAMDDAILRELFYSGIPVFDMESGMPAEDPGWGSPTFHAMGREKISLINVFLSLEYELLICDTDMVWVRDPLPWIARYPSADILSSSDGMHNTVDNDGLEDWEKSTFDLNIGILYYRPTPPARRQARHWARVLAANSSLWDQEAFNTLIRKQLGPSVPSGNGLVWSYDETLKVGIMPVSIFCSGHTYFIQKMHLRLGLQPYAIHTTYQYSGTDGKRHRLREAMLFNDPPAYYNPPNGLLSYDQYIPESLIKNVTDNLNAHFSLVLHQLVQLRAAFGLATLLNRTLVLPELWCRLDTGEDLPITPLPPRPFLCPADHILRIDVMKLDLEEGEFGPIIPFREHSFPKNPRMDMTQLGNRTVIQICHNSHCSHANPTLPPHPSQSQLLRILSPLKTAKWLHFTNVTESIGAWDDKEQEAKFILRLKSYVSSWCCLPPQPEFLFYDFFLDKTLGFKPHRPIDGWVDRRPL